MASKPHEWTGFLPKNAIVMARHPEQLAGEEVLGAQAPAEEIASNASLDGKNSSSNFSESGKNSSSPATVDTLENIATELTAGAGCTKCKLCVSRNSVVVGEGNPWADLVFVGEGPGETEDQQGRPFVGKAGQLLDKMIEAIGLSRDEVYIANVVKCRPPGNRDPEADEVDACSVFLHRQLDVIRPKVVVALGKFAAQTLLGTDEKISSIRGKFFEYRGCKLIPTWHPAYLLRNPEAKREAWADLLSVARELGLEIPARKS